MSTIIIKGTLTTVGALSIKLPRAEGMPENQWGNFPVEIRGLDAEGKGLPSGYLPATTLRGLMRRAVGAVQMQDAAAAGQPYTLSRAYADLIGQNADSDAKPKAKATAAGEDAGATEEDAPPKTKVDLLKLRETRDNNPIIDLFGCGLNMASRLLVDHFRPRHHVLPQIVTAPRKDLGDTDGVLDALPEAAREQYFDRGEANSKRSAAAAVVKGLASKLNKAKKAGLPVADLEAALDEAKAVLQRYTDAMGDMTNSSRTVVHYWALPAGLDLEGKLIIEKARDRDLPMLELALNALSMRPILGAQAARGCGEIKGVFNVYVDGVLTKNISIGGWQPAVVTTIPQANQA